MFYLLFAAFLVRLIGLNQSLWLDEATTARVVQQFNYGQIISVFSPNDFHPPFYYLFMKFWTGLFGYSEVSLRLPSIIASLVTGWLIYKIVVRSVRSVKSLRTTAVWASALFLFNPLVVYYSQEARMYSMVTLFITVIFYYLLRITDYVLRIKGTGSRIKSGMTVVLMGNLFIFLSLVTFYGTVFFVVALYLYLLIKKEYRTLTYLLPGALVAGLVLYPLFSVQLKNSGEVLAQIPNWSLTLGEANLKNLLLIPIKFTSGRISFEPKAIYYLVSGLWLVVVGYLSLRGVFDEAIPVRSLRFARDDKRPAWDDGGANGKTMSRSLMTPMLYFLLAPIALGFLVSFYKPLLQYFRFIYVLPFFAILLCINTQKRWQRYSLLSGFVFFSLLYVFLPQFHREDWKSMVKSLPSGTVCALPSSFDPIHYYNPKIITSDLRSCNTGNRIVVIPYAQEIYGVDHSVLLAKQKYSLDKEVSFRGLKYELWSKK